MREFSPLEMYAGEIKMVPLGRFPERGNVFRSAHRFGRIYRSDSGFASAAARALTCPVDQLAINSYRSQVGHDVVRFTCIRAYRPPAIWSCSSLRKARPSSELDLAIVDALTALVRCRFALATFILLPPGPPELPLANRPFPPFGGGSTLIAYSDHLQPLPSPQCPL